MSIVVSDTSPVRALVHVNHFSLLQTYFSDVVLPPAVVRELEHPAPSFQPVLITHLGNVCVQAPTDTLEVQRLLQVIDRGEAEAIVLARDIRAQALLIDENKGRTVAQAMGLPVTGVVGLLTRAKADGRIPALRPILDDLRHGLGFWLSQQFYESVLKSAGE